MTSEKNKLTSNNLFQRLASALVAVTLVLSVLYFFRSNGAYYLVVVTSIMICIELANLFFDKNKFFRFLVPILTSVGLVLVIQKPESNLSLLPVYLGLISIPWFYRSYNIQETFDKLTIFLLIVFYCLFLPYQILQIFNLDANFLYFGFFALLVFGVDTFAYFFGKSFGRKFFAQKFQPMISPSKTFEGFLGSLLWPLVLILLVQAMGLLKFSWPSYPLLFLTALAAISGDLLASLIKRKSQKKDSGQLFIGHGGFFDRLDSLLLASPLFLIAVPYIDIL